MYKKKIDVMPNVKKQWYSYEGSQVIVELNLPDSYVSAFHFHESIKLELEKKLNSEDIHICDSSSIRELNGLNPVMSILIQSAKKAVQLIGT